MNHNNKWTRQQVLCSLHNVFEKKGYYPFELNFEKWRKVMQRQSAFIEESFGVLPSIDVVKSLFGTSKKLRSKLKRYGRTNASSLATIKKGFERFLNDYGHYPTVVEIDDCEYLPTSKTLQRNYGGVKILRRRLELDVQDYGRGSHRSNIAFRGNKRSFHQETLLKEYLVDRFGEVCVHEEVKWQGRLRLDFVVYTKNFRIAIETITSESIRSAFKNLNLKESRYGNFPYSLFIVLMSKDIKQARLNKRLARKTKPLPEEWFFLTFSSFKKKCDNFEPLLDPRKYHVRWHRETA
jgi:hypothetical protein